MKREQIAEIKARAEKATPGPWTDEDGYRVRASNPNDTEHPLCLVEVKHLDGTPWDNEFIAHARTDVPALLDALSQAMDVFDQSRSILCNVAQLLDGWHADGTAWSKWDEEVRQDVTKLQIAIERLNPRL